MTDQLIPICPDCEKPIPSSGPMCRCIEDRLPGMDLHRSDTLARKLVYLEAVVDMLVSSQLERNRRRKPRAAKRAECAND